METAPTPLSPQKSKATHLLFRVRDALARVGGGDLMDYITERRATAPPTPYRLIARDLTNLTGVDITHEAPRRWYIDHLKQRLPAQGPQPGAQTDPA
jgi:hypothetical protein